MTLTKISANQRKKLRPNPNNRDEAVAGLGWWLAVEELELIESACTKWLNRIPDVLSEGDVKAVLYPFESLASFGLAKAVGEYFSQPNRADVAKLSLYLHYYLSRATIEHHLVRLEDKPAFPEQNEYVSGRPYGVTEFGFFCLAAAFVDTATLRPWSYMLYNQLRCWGIDSEDEPDTSTFVWLLVRSFCEQQWPGKEALPPELTPWYRDLLLNLDQPDALSEALVRYCDYRLARSYGLSSPDAKTKKWDAYVCSHREFCLFPVELLALQRIYQVVTGKEISLDAPHPLLQTPLMRLPVNWQPLASDPLLEQAQALARDYFGKNWQPDYCVPLLSYEEAAAINAKDPRRGKLWGLDRPPRQ